MARDEQDREDLMREATALVERVELRTAGEPESVIVGFRRNGCASVFFGADRAYHFNAANELRRAYVAGVLWKAQERRLIAMRRERTGTQVELRSQPLDEAEQQVELAQVTSRLQSLREDLAHAERSSIVACFPSDAPVLERVQARLAALPSPINLAQRPHAE
jgi:hypothetical protein